MRFLFLLSVIFVLISEEPVHAADRPESVVILVHGVWSKQDVFKSFDRTVVAKQLPGAWLVKFEWGEELPFRASDSVGARPNSAFGMSDHGFVAAAKLKEVVAQCRELLGKDIPINLVTHSQGSVIALSCLQEGMTVNNWVLMGSPLDKENITDGDENTSLGAAAKKVTGKVVNLWSDEDAIAGIKGGIGRFGLPRKIHGLRQQLRSGIAGNVLDVFVDGVDHFGDNSWWTSEWLEPKDTREWRGPVNKQKLLTLLGSRTAKKTTPSKPFKKIASFAAEGTRKTKWSKIFGDNDEDGFEYVFTLTPGMTNGIHFDDKDVAKFKVECLQGSCEMQIKSATYSSWDRVNDPLTVKAGTKREGNFEVKFRRTFIRKDATVYLRVTNTAKGITKVRCRLSAEDV